MAKFNVKPGDVKSGILEQQQKADAQRDVLIEERDGDYGDISQMPEELAHQIESDIDSPELVESIEIKLPNGSIVEMRAPTAFQGFVIDRMFANQPFAQTSRAYATALMHVEKINGQPFRKPTVEGECQSKANYLGPGGMDTVFQAYTQFFAGSNKLQVLKKNLRDS